MRRYAGPTPAREGERDMELHWEQDSRIVVRTEGGAVVVSANREGLLSLAHHLAALAEETPGSHIHYDGMNALEDGSTELIVERTE